jgi:hypothetical protein
MHDVDGRGGGSNLTTDDLARIDEAIPAGAAAGGRYHTQQMALLDSERG